MCKNVTQSNPERNSHRFQAFLCDDELHSESLMNHIFDIERPEARAYHALNSREETTAQELAEHLDRHPSNVYEALNGLYETGFATRRRRVPENGGQEYVFSSVPAHDAVQIMRNEFEQWVTQTRQELETLESPPR